jgi:hypothetical protein
MNAVAVPRVFASTIQTLFLGWFGIALRLPNVFSGVVLSEHLFQHRESHRVFWLSSIHTINPLNNLHKRKFYRGLG